MRIKELVVVAILLTTVSSMPAFCASARPACRPVHLPEVFSPVIVPAPVRSVTIGTQPIDGRFVPSRTTVKYAIVASTPVSSAYRSAGLAKPTGLGKR